MQKLQLEGGKYELRCYPSVGVLTAWRYGEPWRDFTGDKLVGLLFDAALAASEAQAEPAATLHDDGYWTPKQSEAGRLLNDRLMRAGSRVDVYTHPAAPQQPAQCGYPACQNGTAAGCQGACSKQPAPAERGEQTAPASPMTPDRARYFMERFLHEEKMLGPNEQAALRYVIGLLQRGEQTAQGVADEQLDAMTAAARDELIDHIYEHGTISEGVQRRVRAIARAALASAPRVPPELDVRRILLRVVPGDGNGEEVYAKSVADVEQLLYELGERVEDLEGAAPRVPQGWKLVPVQPTEAMLDAGETVVSIGPMDGAHVDDRVVVNGQWQIGEADGTHEFEVQGRRTGPARLYAAMLAATSQPEGGSQ